MPHNFSAFTVAVFFRTAVLLINSCWRCVSVYACVPIFYWLSFKEPGINVASCYLCALVSCCCFVIALQNLECLRQQQASPQRDTQRQRSHFFLGCSSHRASSQLSNSAMKIFSLTLLCYFCWRLIGFATTNFEASVPFLAAAGSQLVFALCTAASVYKVSRLGTGTPIAKLIGASYGIMATQTYFLLEESTLDWQVASLRQQISTADSQGAHKKKPQFLFTGLTTMVTKVLVSSLIC